ncbi:hypothetical protein [Aliirhizobium smilacinae]|uniref:DUF2946 domain-containing protein n=1 Tax=Aliirhizobium smilacinae TaxID=1395944 RepID=A0A5C4XFT2_9HYPH|nr:hypothetical protein [Rhizobium smilacinae]TNM62139.1 hypothetical protein FHP24_18780 [Rhizobium smilacinae]
MRRKSGIMAQFVCILILSLIDWAGSTAYAMPSAGLSSGAFAEAYRLPDGTFAVICSESGQHEKQTGDRHCDQCVTAGPVALASPVDDMVLPDLVWHIGLEPVVRSQLAEMLSIDRATSRGPPFAVSSGFSTI